MSKTWEILAKQKRDSVNALIPERWLIPQPIPSPAEQRDVTGAYIQQYLSAQEIEITETDAVGIVAKTTSGAWKSRDVTEAFCHRAALAHQLVNCLHEIFFSAALDDAQRLDDYYAEHKKPIGPLHGLPISLKDQFHVKGVETTMGYVGWIDTFESKKGTGKERAFESELVKELKSLGAILYVKTAVPHTLMSAETTNNIIGGFCYNPKNRNLLSGGSSGGEGALIGLKGSPIGFGTDIGGSVRIPAAFNGLYGLRPSSGRLPYEGMANSMDGQNSILSVVGPLATSVGAIKLVMKAIFSTKPWFHDPLVSEIPWRDEMEKQVLDSVKTNENGKQLVFGLLKGDDLVQAQPPLLRALEIVKKTAEKLGHKVVEWTPPSHQKGLELAFQTWAYDGGADVYDSFELSGEPISQTIANNYPSRKEEYTASKIAKINVLKREYQKEYMEYWNSTIEITGTGRPVDAVFAPCAPYAAGRPNMYTYYGLSVWVNLLDYSTSILPVTFVDKSVDVVQQGYQAMNEEDQKVFDNYDPEIYDGAPVAIQIVARRFQEEKVLAITEMLGDALGKQTV